MRKSKGFTLIELLAVIVVLAVIALIATPIVLNLVNKAKEGAAEASAYAYVKEVETYIMLTKLNPDLPKLENGKTYEVSKIKYEEVAFIDLFIDRVYAEEANTIYLNDIIEMKGEKPTSGKVTIEDNGISEAKFVVKGYNVVCDEEICKVNGKSKVEKKELKIELGEVIVTYDSITIPFTVNEDADEDVEIKIHYGTTADLGNEAVCENNKCEITGLTQKTTYYYKVVVKDTFGNEVILPSDTLANTTTIEKDVLCKRAIKLNTAVCQSPSGSYHCAGAGYASGATVSGNTITYGRLGEAGKLTSGDAFDCDVNNDDKFEERFYYVTDSNTGNAVLIYNYNTKGGVKDTANEVKYDESVHYNGPRTARNELPTTTQWSNPKIIYPTTRAILNENGEGVTWKYNLTQSFSYKGYAARLLTAQELNTACNMKAGIDHHGAAGAGIMKNCLYFLENTNFQNYKITPNGYWLETAASSHYSSGWIVDAYYRNVKLVSSEDAIGVRPVIEVAKDDIEI